MANADTFLVSKSNFSNTKLAPIDVSILANVEAGEVLLKVDRFALTANNITYAALGDKLQYWRFFPGEENYGVIPVWGFAEVLLSKCDGIEVGERFYGYYPMASHLKVVAEKVTKYNFLDGAAHRQGLAHIYNQYTHTSNDPLYTQDSEALQMLLRPLFTTSFLLDDFFNENSFFNANTIVLTSASSKTALGLAFLLNHNRKANNQDIKIIGLTSSGNLDFVKGLGIYDEVLEYSQVPQLDQTQPTVTVDFAGNSELMVALHGHLNGQLQYSCMVGVSHWDQQTQLPKDLAGPKPTMFFAPSQAQKRLKEWGPEKFQTIFAGCWIEFNKFVKGWMQVEEATGEKAVSQIYQQVLAGRSQPNVGHCLSLWTDDKN